jgi:hypothetical protein
VTRAQRQIEEHRQGEACVEVRDSAGRPRTGVAVWAEQESHAFAFGCCAPGPGDISERDRQRWNALAGEVFPRLLVGSEPAVAGATRVAVPENVHLGRYQSELDRLAADGSPLVLSVTGRCIGLIHEGTDKQERAAADRAAALYSLCFAHPAVCGIVWNGLWDGEEYVWGDGLLRADFAPKRACRYLHKLIGTVWHSRADGTTGADGRFRFRGFFGTYRVAARIGDAPATVGVFEHRRGNEAPFVLTIPDEPSA